jgi:hypothetical protein
MLSRAETEASITPDITVILGELAGMYVLDATDATQTLTVASYYLTYPTDALDSEQAIQEVVLTDSSSVQLEPLDVLARGWHEYCQLMKSFASGDRSTPTQYIAHDRKIYLYPAPNGTYTTSITYYKRHPAGVSNIVFSGDWDNAMRYGVVAQVCLHYGLDAAYAKWYPRYREEAERQRISHSR